LARVHHCLITSIITPYFHSTPQDILPKAIRRPIQHCIGGLPPLAIIPAGE